MMHSVIYEWASKNVKGFDDLCIADKEFFLRTYTTHQACHGSDYKDKWKAVSVKREETYLRVDFANGGWLHYYLDGTWG